MKEKGFSLVECVLVILLVGLLSMTVMIGNKYIKKARFKGKVNEIVQCIEYAKNAGARTGRFYSVLSYGKVVYVIANNHVIYKVPLDEDMYFDKQMTGTWIRFRGTVATAGKGGTIRLEQKGQEEYARITIVPVTGKVRVYYEHS